MASGPYTIMMVEDNPGDRMLTKMAFEEAQVEVRFIEVGDGAEALSRLQREPPYQDERRPDLMILDLNLPKLDGWEVLRILKADPELRALPVIVLSSSDAPRDICEVYERQGNSYFIKPLDMNRLAQIVERIRSYWLDGASLPPRHD